MTDSEFIFSAESVCFENGWSKENVENLLNSESGLSVTDKEKRGYVIGNIILDEAELYRIAVLPEYRGQKIGKKLISEFISLCREKGAAKIFLEVRSKNVPAINLYEQSGFEKISVRKRYYGDDDALIYMLVM